LNPNLGAELAKFRSVMRMATETMMITGQFFIPEVGNPGQTSTCFWRSKPVWAGKRHNSLRYKIW